MTPRLADLIRRSHATLTALAESENKLTLPQFALLSCLKEHGDKTRSNLCTLTGIDRSTLCEMVNRLRSMGYIAETGERRIDQDGGRSASVLKITSDGRAALNGAERKVWLAEKMMLDSLSPVERSKLLFALGIIAYTKVA